MSTETHPLPAPVPADGEMDHAFRRRALAMVDDCHNPKILREFADSADRIIRDFEAAGRHGWNVALKQIAALARMKARGLEQRRAGEILLAKQRAKKRARHPRPSCRVLPRARTR